jgi:putative transposase
MAPETNRRMSADLAMGRRTLPSLKQYVDSFTAVAGALPRHAARQARTAARPHRCGPSCAGDGRDGHGRHCPPSRGVHGRPPDHAPAQPLLFRRGPALYDAQKVDVEYDLHHDDRVWVFDKKGRFVVEAKLVNKIGVLPTSRLEEGRDRRLQGQLKRLERKVDEARSAATTRSPPTTRSRHRGPASPLLPPPPPPPPPRRRDRHRLLSWRNDK